jgi:glucose/arabinose dehydrogenase
MPETDTFAEAVQVGAMAPLPDGGLRVGERISGEIYDLDAEGERTGDSASVDVSRGGDRGLLGLAISSESGDTYAAWTDAETDTLVVGQVLPGPTREIWRGPAASNVNLGGDLAFTPDGRLVLAIGDLRGGESAETSEYSGKIVTLAPDMDSNQRPNIISEGWENPKAMAYDIGANLWVADGDQLARVAGDGTIGDSVTLGDSVGASGLTLMGNEELAVCTGANQTLQRYMISNGTELIEGRKIADDCSLDVEQLSDGRIVYATAGTIEVTVD